MVFGCISKNFPENIFWCLEKKKENHKFRKTQATTQIAPSDDRNPRSRSTDLHLGSRDLPRRIFLSDLSAYIRHVAISDLPLRSLGLHTTCRDLGSSSLAVDRDLDSARSHEGEITINGAISPSRDRDQRHNLATARSRPMTLSRDGEIMFVASPLAHARTLSLSLSHFPEML